MIETPVVLVSGGSKGLGLVIVEECLNAGWSVATFSRKETDAVLALRARFSERFFYTTGDQSRSQSSAEIVQAVHDRFGRLDALVNNAALAYDGMLATMRRTDLENLIQVNVTSVLLLTRESIRRFLLLPRKQRKSIINISSVVSVTGYRGLAAYAATKSALLGMTRSLARELGPANVTVNVVLPGFLETDMSQGLTASQKMSIVRRTALGRLGNGADVAPLVRFLLSEDAGFITGQSFIVDGGASC